MSNRQPINRSMPVPPLPNASEAASFTEEQPQEEPKMIEVIALRNGFYGGKRRTEGERFLVSSKQALGSWMKCVDVGLEKEHKKAMELKKLAGK